MAKYSVTLTGFNVLQCKRCSEIVLDDAADERLSEALRKEAGLLSPQEIHQNRLALGYTQQQLADYLRISMFTLSRWETGAQIQQRGMDALMRVFFQSREARDPGSSGGNSTVERSCRRAHEHALIQCLTSAAVATRGPTPSSPGPRARDRVRGPRD